MAECKRAGLISIGRVAAQAVAMLLLVPVASSPSAPVSQMLDRATDLLNPRVDTAAVLDLREWDNNRLVQTGTYDATFLKQEGLLLRKTIPEKDRGRRILLIGSRLWVELPSARRPLQLSSEQRWTSDALFADMARANFSRDYKIVRVVSETQPEALHFYLQGKQANVPFPAVELWLDKATQKPLHAQFTTSSKAFVRNCVYESFVRVAGEERPTRFAFSDPVRPGWKAELIFNQWRPLRAERKWFDPGALNKEELFALPAQRPTQTGAHLQPVKLVSDDMVRVPEGSFIMGRNNGFPDEQPAHSVFVKDFRIDRTEVTVGQYKRFLLAKHYPRPSHPTSFSMPPDYFTNAAYDNFPVVNVTWKKAGEFCHWSGKRLPTEAEWEKAARGTDERLYPWGDQFDYELANSRESTVGSLPNSLQHFTDPVGNFPLNSSPYGALDMAGNVWEWVDSWYGAYPGSKSPNEAYGQRYRVVRGGSWVSNSLSLLSVARDFSPPEFGYDSIGFRCAKSSSN